MYGIGTQCSTSFLQCYFLSSVGGISTEDVTRRVLRSTMKNELAAEYNWAGKAPKRSFKTLRTRHVVVCK